MQTGFYSNTGGMVTQFNRLDVISNNLANLNTSGYKRDDVVIGDFMRLYQEERDILPLDNNTREGSQFLNRSIVRVPHVVEEFTDHDVGALQRTGNVFDMALAEEGSYLGILTPGGIRYTRDGSFVVNGEGILTTKEGFPVLPAGYTEGGELISVPIDREISVTGQGEMYLLDKANLQANEYLNQVMVVRPENVKYMVKEGNSMYRSYTEMAQLDGDNLVRQGYVEKSNVNAVREMTALIETNRLVDMYQKAMDSHMNDMNSDAIEKLAARA